MKVQRWIRKITMSALLFSFLLIGCSSYQEAKVPSANQEQVEEKGVSVEVIDSKVELAESAYEEVPVPLNPEELKEKQLMQYISQMTLKEKLGQLLMVVLPSDEGGTASVTVNEPIKQLFRDYPVGGIILFKDNLVNKEQTKTLISELQDLSSIPLFMGVDEEGGVVSRVGANKAINEIPFKEAFSLGKTGETQLAYEEALRMGRLLKELGFNMDFAPVADIYNEPNNTVIGRRSFGTTQAEVTPMVIAFSKGLKEAGILAVTKHFPGHGNTKEDSHNGLAYVNKTQEALEREELVPFEKAMEAGAEGMMRGHLVASAIDSIWPATLSQKWGDYITKHYDTSKILLITDALNMGAIVENYSTKEAVVGAFLAGNDILLMPTDLSEAMKELETAYHSGEITEERLNASVKKILSKKMEHLGLQLE